MAGFEDYPKTEVAMALSLLLELLEHLKAYKEHIVLVGGWAPYFLIQKSELGAPEHVGSLDADLVLDFRSIPESAYETINEILGRAGYSPRRDPKGKIVPASFEKLVPLEGGGVFPMQVDFLAGEYGGTSRSHRHQEAQDLLARKARGADIVFDHCYMEEISGRLPNRAKITASIKVANEIAVFVMKGITLGQRTKAKDFYDLYMLIKYFKSGPQSIAESLRGVTGNALVKEAIRNIAQNFQEFESLGPIEVTEFLHPADPEARAIVQRDAFELFQTLIRRLSH